jgi:hypothetical protein
MILLGGSNYCILHFKGTPTREFSALVPHSSLWIFIANTILLIHVLYNSLQQVNNTHVILNFDLFSKQKLVFFPITNLLLVYSIGNPK